MKIGSNIILWLIDLVLSLVEGLLTLRIALKLFGASTTAPFVTWVYETTNPILKPFIGMFPSPHLSGGFIIEFSSMFALVSYALLGFLLSEVIEHGVHFNHTPTKDAKLQ